MSKIITFEIVKNFIETNSECKLISKEYIKSKEKLKIQCKCRNIFNSSFDAFRNGKRQCNNCSSIKKKLNKIFSYDFVKHTIEDESNRQLITKEYINNSSKIEIKCECGNIFKTSLSSFMHKNKKQCDSCTSKKMSQSQSFSKEYVKNFVENNSNCLLLVNNYINNKTKLKLLCECGEIFLKPFADFKYNIQRTCKKCGYIKIGEKLKYTYEQVKQFIEIDSASGCKLISKEYTNVRSEIQIQCKCSKVFITNFAEFKNAGKQFCNDCGYEIGYDKRRLDYNFIKCYVENLGFELLSTSYKNNSQKLILKSKDSYIHYISLGHLQEGKTSNEFHTANIFTIDNIKLWLIKEQKDFVLLSSQYKNAESKLQWKCIKCDYVWNSSWTSIQQGKECSHCNRSKGERIIERFSMNHNIYFDPEYSIPDLISKKGNPLRFDFSIFNNKEKTDLNCLIEYDGEQHFRWIQGMQTETEYIAQTYHDKLKNEYCLKNNIKLIRIPYWDFDNIESILQEELTNLIHI